MSQIYNPRYVFWAQFFSVIISPFYLFFNLFRKSKMLQDDEINNIIVCQYHRIGDVIMIAPILASLKEKFPNAKTTLLCCPGAVTLAKELHIGDEVIGITVPWTTWDWSFAKWWEARLLAQSFREKNVDLVIDFKGDLRNSWFLWHMKPKMSIGYADTGGSFFYTHVQSVPSDAHQTERSLKLISYLGCNAILQLNKEHIPQNDGSIVIHTGGSDPKRSWPTQKWIDLAESLSTNHLISFVKTPETELVIERIIDKKINAEIFEGDLVTFLNWLKNQKMLVGIDSMPGHLAAYLGVPVVSIFGSQNPAHTRPLGKWVEIIKPDLSCKHDRDHWRLCSLCMDSIDVGKVSSGVKTLIAQVENR